MSALLDDGAPSFRVITYTGDIGFLHSFISRLEIGTGIATASVPTTKILVLQSTGPNLAAVVHLRYFTCLEKLYVRMNL
uniref:Uncharacterized protein n=1 Tax=Oryza barthii TaxID=65489 RepID=A0A0D3GPN8_9ORYZ